MATAAMPVIPVNNLTIKRGGTNGTDGEDNVGLFGVISGGSVG
jgi:hypothetical protein